MVVNALISGPVYGGAGLWVDSLESEFGWSRTQLSIAFSIGQLEGSLAAPMVGFLIDKFGGKKMIMVGAVFAACGFLIMSQTRPISDDINNWFDPLIFYVSYVVIMIGVSLGSWIPTSVIINSWFNRFRSFALSVGSVGFAIGTFAIVPILAFLVNPSYLGWRGTSIMLVFVFLCLLVPEFKFLKNNPEEIDEIPVASEGDVLGAVTQIIAKSLTGKVGYLLDMTEPDFETGKLLMWHGGGGPLYLANSDGVKWVNHPMIGRGTSEGPIYGTISDLVFKDGPVTVFRVVQNANSIFQMTSEVKGINPNGFIGCRGWLENFQMEDENITLKDLVSTVMYHGIEHHFILIPGNLRDELNELSAWSGMHKLELKHMKNYVL